MKIQNQYSKTSASEVYDESMRYIGNAHQILKEKGKKENGYYYDKKYVRMACHTAYVGVLEALRHLIHITKKNRLDILAYRNFLTIENKKMLGHLDNAYGVLHLYGGYDGLGKQETLQSGFKSAIEIINWVKSRLA